MIDHTKLSYLKNIPRDLHKDNIEEAIQLYKVKLLEGPVKVESEETPYAFLKAIKRDKLATGPYAGVSLFEAANRIMSDLVILYGVRLLLKKDFDGIKFDLLTVCLGNENHAPHDINAHTESYELLGEAFNVAESFFYLKKRSSMQKLMKPDNHEKRFIVLLYNDDATSAPTKREGSVFHIPVTIDL